MHPSLNTHKLRPEHLDRQAFIYVRQSTLLKVRDNTASTARQYDLVQRTTLNTEQELMLRYYERLKTAGYMNPTPAPATDLFSRTVNTLFQPEPVRVGKATVAFSPITAIKRKNPLALLNPIVLNISW